MPCRNFSCCHFSTPADIQLQKVTSEASRVAGMWGPEWETKVDALGILAVISCADYGAL